MNHRTDEDNNDSEGYEQPEAYVYSEEEANLKKLLLHVCERNPEYLNRLKSLVTRIVKCYPAWQWCARSEWSKDKIEEIYGFVCDKLFGGNLIRFWVSARSDTCVIQANLNNLVFNIIQKLAPKTGKLFHTHTANQLADDPEFVKENLTMAGSKRITQIGLARWNHRTPCHLTDNQLIELWKKSVKLPKYANAHNLKPVQRAEIFRQMLESAGGWVDSKDFYRGYILITGFAFTSVCTLEENPDDEENTGADKSGFFAFIEACSIGSLADEREKIRQSIVESHDSWKPFICSLLEESAEIRRFLQIYFLEIDRNKSEAAERVGRSPTWATNTMNAFFERLTTGVSYDENIEEYDKKAFVQLILHQLAAYQSGEQRP